MSEHLSNSELKRWAAIRADDAGRLSREVLALRARVAKLEAALNERTHALESYAHDNASTELAVSIAAHCKA